VGRFRMVPTVANGQPAAAAYVRSRGEGAYEAFALGVLSVAGGEIVEITAFHDPGVFRAFGLPLLHR
jgi:RNA polymerase sigma-70 factor, ECF subfamily